MCKQKTSVRAVDLAAVIPKRQPVPDCPCSGNKCQVATFENLNDRYRFNKSDEIEMRKFLESNSVVMLDAVLMRSRRQIASGKFSDWNSSAPAPADFLIVGTDHEPSPCGPTSPARFQISLITQSKRLIDRQVESRSRLKATNFSIGLLWPTTARAYREIFWISSVSPVLRHTRVRNCSIGV